MRHVPTLLPVLALAAVAACAEIGTETPTRTDGPVRIELDGTAYDVALGQLRSGCSDPALAELECEETSMRSKVTREGAAFAGTEDERAAARLVTGRACEAAGLEPGRFGPADGNFQDGIWVFDDACA